MRFDVELTRFQHINEENSIYYMLRGFKLKREITERQKEKEKEREIEREREREDDVKDINYHKM